MTKKDYEAIAGAFRTAFSMREAGDITAYEEAESLQDLIANYAASDNPRFDRARFLAACRGEDSKEGCWTDKDHGLAFCYECLDSITKQYGPVEDVDIQNVRENGYTAPIECENCGEEIRKMSSVE